MAKTTNQVRFYLKDTQAKTETLIFARFTIKTGERLKYSTGEKINPIHWDNSTQKALIAGKDFDSTTKRLNKEINLQLGRYEGVIERINSMVRYQDLQPTTTLYVEELDKEFKKQPTKKKDQKPNLIEYAKQYHQDCKKGLRKNKDGLNYSYNTIKQVLTALNILIKFSKKYKRLEFEQLDKSFRDSLVAYLTDDLQYSKNSIGTTVKNIKAIIREAFNDGLHNNYIFRDHDFKNLTERVENIYLSDEEVRKLFELDLVPNTALDRVRDLFLIGCYTGLRFSDFTTIRPENIQGRILNIITQKTGEQVCLPVRPELKAILDKYYGVLPPAMTNQKMNECLKTLGQMIELNEQRQFVKTKGGRKIFDNVQKWEKLTTHTARRSFATNAYLAGLQTIDIMQLTGHTTEKNFLKYIKITKQQTANRLLEHPYFMGVVEEKIHLRKAI